VKACREYGNKAPHILDLDIIWRSVKTLTPQQFHPLREEPYFGIR
jgi:hypothetical protein